MNSDHELAHIGNFGFPIGRTADASGGGSSGAAPAPESHPTGSGSDRGRVGPASADTSRRAAHRAGPSVPWSPAEDAELLYQQLVERAASSLVLGDEGLAADYLALIPRPPMPPLRGARTDLLLTFGRAVLAAERLRDSRTDY